MAVSGLVSSSTDTMMKRVGFFVNPIAGVGGELAWKGTFNVDQAWEVSKVGKELRSINRARKAIESIPSHVLQSTYFLVPNGLMGSAVLNDIKGVSYEVVLNPSYPTHEEDTRAFIRQACKENVDLLVFAGGDGTAFIVKEEMESCKHDIPVIGIPTGVKITSECYLHHPQALGELLEAWLRNETRLSEAMVSDLDEQAYRKQQVVKRIAGPVLTLSIPRILQGEKLVTQELTPDPEVLEMELEELAETLEDEGILQQKLIAGAGTTTYSVFKHYGIEKTLLGVDIIENGEITRKDVDCKTLREWFHDLNKEEQKNVRIVITPIGGQGYIFGRGNQQICCEVLDFIQQEQVVIIATTEKLQDLPSLKIDTDCEEFQKRFNGVYLRVQTSGNREVVRKVQE